MMITTSRIALITFSVTCALTGIFVPMDSLNTPITSVIPKKMNNPTKAPRITAAAILRALGLGGFSGIESLFTPCRYIEIGIEWAGYIPVKLKARFPPGEENITTGGETES